MPDDKFELPVMQPGLEDRTEQQDAETLQQELDEQLRIAGETGGVFDRNRQRRPSGEAKTWIGLPAMAL